MSSIKTTEIEGDVSIGRHVGVGGNAHVQGNAVVKKNLIVDGWLEAKNVKSANKGLFTTVEKLREAYPRPHDGWWAIVGRSLPAPIYVADGGAWVATGENGGNPTVDSERYDSNISELQGDLYTTKTDVKGIKDDVKALKTQVTAQGDSVNQTRTAVETAQQTAENAKNDVKALKTQVTAQGDSVNQTRTAVETAQQTAENAKKAASDVNAELTTLKDSKGKANGIAPLDEDGKVPAAYLPSYVDDVIEFDGCMDNLTTQQQGIDMLSTDEHAKVIYNRTDNIFVLAVKTQENEATLYYDSWVDQDKYGVFSRNGFAPISGKVYIDSSDNTIY
ncbi:hypothetical protein ABVC73_04945 [Prevotella melaninogenica]